MAVIAPQTDVYLLKVPLEIDNTNQLTFANATAQYNYFSSLPKITVDDFTYQRKDGTIRFGACFDDIIGYNYVMYRNDAYSNKWFYAFIDNMQYMNDNMTAISISTDTWQTWQFDLTYKRCFVEREHVNDDTVGANRIPEDLEIGELRYNGMAMDIAKTDFSTGYLCLGVTELISPFDSNPLTNWLTVYGGLFSGLNYMLFDSLVSLQRVIDYYNKNKTGDGGIQTIFYVPKAFVDASDPKRQTYTLSSQSNTAEVIWLEPTESAVHITTSMHKPINFIYGYTNIKNNKLKTYPYAYFTISNNAGTEIEYRYEDFPEDTMPFAVDMTLCPSMAMKFYPQNYLGSYDTKQMWEQGVIGAKTPQCSWHTDYYTNWLTQNAVNVATGPVSTAMQAVQNFAFGNPFGVASSIFNGITSQVNAKYQAKLMPDQIHGDVNAGDIAFSAGRTCFTYNQKCIMPQFASIIDNYFSMFGYKVNDVKIPNITGRANWNYVKTIGCYIEADIPQEDLQDIKNMFDRGVTFWHNPSTFCDYSQNNAII